MLFPHKVQFSNGFETLLGILDPVAREMVSVSSL